MSDLTTGPFSEPNLSAEQSAEVSAFVENAKSPNTRRAYRLHWGKFAEWCAEQRVAPLGIPAPFLAAYLVHLQKQGIAPASIDLFLSAFSFAHERAEVHSCRRHPLVKATRSGIRRAVGVGQTKKKPIDLDLLAKCVAGLPATLAGLRSRAILLLGFAGAWRRAELATIHTTDLRWSEDQLDILLPKSKTDQEGRGQVKSFRRGTSGELCPCVALRTWLDAAHIANGWVFPAFETSQAKMLSTRPMTGTAIAAIVKAAVARVGLDPKDFAGHSLRAGFVTDRLARGISAFSIIRQTGHESLDTLKKYDRRVKDLDEVSTLRLEPREEGGGALPSNATAKLHVPYTPKDPTR